jgi:hypothetical protein
MTEGFAIYDASGAPLAGQTPAWEAQYDAATGASKSLAGPAFRELGGGLYAFDRPLDYDLVGVVDMGEGANPRYGLAPARTRESLALYRATSLTLPAGEGEDPEVIPAGAPLTGASPVFTTLLRATSETAVAEPPMIQELGGGVYTFPRPSPDEHWVGIIDGGADASPRYHYFEVGRGLRPVAKPGNLGQGVGRVGRVLD